MTPDMINGIFEAMGAMFVAMHARATWRARSSAGVSIVACIAFTVWGAWNLFYYPHLNQWWSFTGGIAVFAVNIVWLWLVIRYRARPE